MNSYQQFLQLHRNPSAFLLGNIWDVHSAKIFSENGYAAIGTSSHAIAAANGYKDGEQLPFEILLQTAKRVTNAVSTPFTVDMEAGYGNCTEAILENLDKLHANGIIGINIEDSVPAA